MRPKGSAAELEVRRRLAANLLLEGRGIREVARLVRAAPSSVKRWQDTLQKRGSPGLKAKLHPGRRPRLSKRQKQQLVSRLRRGPLAAGYPTDLWTCPRVAQVIQRHFGVQYHPGAASARIGIPDAVRHQWNSAYRQPVAGFRSRN